MEQGLLTIKIKKGAGVIFGIKQGRKVEINAVFGTGPVSRPKVQ